MARPTILPLGYNFDDVLLVPQRSEIGSRSEVNTSTTLGDLNLTIPVISANMDTITENAMAIQMGKAGGAGILHRYASVRDVISWIRFCKEFRVPAIPSVGVQSEDYKAVLLYKQAGADAICVDIAHGHSTAALKMVKYASKHFTTVIAGNVATGRGVIDLHNAGARVVKVGVGPGSVCTTRYVTGHGVPQLTAIMDCADAAEKCAMGGWGAGCYIIADGGLKTPGDVVKALAAGADAVMLGGMLAGTEECPEVGRSVYRGMASTSAQLAYRGKVSNNAAEGTEELVEDNGPVLNVIDKVVGGIRSGLSYSGCQNLAELREAATFIEVNKIK